MPKKISTKKTYASNTALESFKNICNAVAEAMGTTATIDTSTPNFVGEMSMESVGFPEMTLKFRRETASSNSVVINPRNNETDMGPEFNSWLMFNGQYPANNAITAICVTDANKDSVVICVTHGDSPNSEATYDMHPLVIFVGRDVNNNILFGVGSKGHINGLCCGYKVVNATLMDVRNQFVTNTLHVTKMINYLAEGLPEMKSTYVSLMRPISRNSASESQNEKNQSYYADGKLWFVPGDSTWLAELYSPIDPIINY